MNITIHRGTHQIGGSVTEIACGGDRVFVDFGEVLPGAEKQPLPPIEGLTCGDVSRSALFLTHYHGDHIGKLGDVADGLPVYIGKTALAIVTCLEQRLLHIPDPFEASTHQRLLERLASARVFEPLQRIRVGNMVVTPLMIDHSAFDAYMFIIEGDNRRILHTGDFRGHGFRGKALVSLLKLYATNIDYIISEGTTLLRPQASMQSEKQLQDAFRQQFLQHKYTFVLVSSTNIDRIVGLYHAARGAKRCFVCDEYQADILRIVAEGHAHYSPFYNMELNPAAAVSERAIILQRKGRRPLQFHGKLKPYLDERGFCLLIRSTEAFKSLLEAYAGSPDFSCLYSMWDGYLDKRRSAYNEALDDFLKPFSLTHLHTSGHADVDTLRLVFETVKPKCGVIPMHTEDPEGFEEMFKDVVRVVRLRDGVGRAILLPTCQSTSFL